MGILFNNKHDSYYEAWTRIVTPTYLSEMVVLCPMPTAPITTPDWSKIRLIYLQSLTLKFYGITKRNCQSHDNKEAYLPRLVSSNLPGHPTWDGWMAIWILDLIRFWERVAKTVDGCYVRCWNSLDFHRLRAGSHATCLRQHDRLFYVLPTSTRQDFHNILTLLQHKFGIWVPYSFYEAKDETHGLVVLLENRWSRGFARCRTD